MVSSKNVFITVRKSLEDCDVFYISKQRFIFSSNSVWKLLVACDHLVMYLVEGHSVAVIAQDIMHSAAPNCRGDISWYVECLVLGDTNNCH